MISSLGIFMATSVLAFAGFAEGAKPGQVPDEVLRTLGMANIPLIVGLYGVAVALLFAYNIDRSKHDANLATLRDRKIATET
jgi:Na+/melibiose symporter-like transporter